MKILAFLWAVAVFLFGHGLNISFAQQTIDFPTAMELARKNNPDWKAAEQEIEIARGKLTTARLISPFNPTVEGQTGRRTIPEEGKGGDYGVGLSMELEVAGQRGLRVTEAERNLQRAESEIALRRREVLPNPTVGVFFNREGSGERTVIGGLSIPLPVFNRRQGELEGLEARKIQARAELLALEKEIRKEVEQAINQWEVARKNTDLFQREVIEQTEENFRLLEAAYRERRIDLPRLLIMENDFISANQSYLDALLSLREAVIRLQEVSGEVR